MDKTHVVFRTFKDDSSLIALFPYDIQNSYGDCNSFQFVGQHAPADYLGVMSKTVRSNPHEVRRMKTSLEIKGYKNIVEVKRRNVKEVEKAHKKFRQSR